MKYCSECAFPVSHIIPPDDNRLRFVCTHCGVIHYQNPKMVVGSIPVWERDGQASVLLCKRAIEPRRGYWTLPAGFMENKETTAEAALRETVEESGANIELREPFTLLSVPHVDQVHLFYRAILINLDFAAGLESLEVKMFTEAEIPWHDLAFHTVSETLKLLFSDMEKVKRGDAYGFHARDIVKPTRGPE